MEVLQEIRQCCGPDAVILIDSGFRRGTDVVKALALGANGVLIGRPVLYGVAAFGEAGAKQALNIILQEMDRTLAQLGCTSIAQLGPIAAFSACYGGVLICTPSLSRSISYAGTKYYLPGADPAWRRCGFAYR